MHKTAYIGEFIITVRKKDRNETYEVSSLRANVFNFRALRRTWKMTIRIPLKEIPSQYKHRLVKMHCAGRNKKHGSALFNQKVPMAN